MKSNKNLILSKNTHVIKIHCRNLLVWIIKISNENTVAFMLNKADFSALSTVHMLIAVLLIKKISVSGLLLEIKFLELILLSYIWRIIWIHVPHIFDSLSQRTVSSRVLWCSSFDWSWTKHWISQHLCDIYKLFILTVKENLSNIR